MSDPNFDGIASAYRWMEYLALGPLLEQTRNSHLDLIGNRSQALILGDGDGRFTARLLRQNPMVQVEAVDLSGRMLELLRSRCEGNADRLRTHQADARSFVPTAPADLVVTHFFLDCLTQREVEALVERLTSQMAAECAWLVSDFRIPDGPEGWFARAYVRALYFTFHILTGLRVTRLPNHAKALERCGFRCAAQQVRSFGMLTFRSLAAG